MKIETIIELLNTIRDNASESYSERVPVATQNNLTDLGGVLLGNIDLANEFTSSLMNKIAVTYVHNKIFANPLAMLKKGMKPLGDTVEEIFINFAKADVYDPTGVNLLGRKLPDVKAVYHKMNRKDRYKVTISREMLAKAFTSYNGLSTFINGILNSLYNGASLDEFVIFKQLINSAIENGAMKVIAIEDPTISSANASKFVKAIKTVSGGMSFPSDQYNGYTQVQNTDTLPVITFTPKNEQLLIIDNYTDVNVDVDVLASAFNLSKVEFMAKKIVIDAFPRADVRACLIDVNFSQIYDDLFEVRTFQNAEGLYDNYYLHVWQTDAYSPLVNAVAFAVGDDADSDGSVEEFEVTYTLATGVKSSNKETQVIEGTSYNTEITLPAGDFIVTVEMGSVDVTATKYDATSGIVNIAEVTGDIEITVVVDEG